MFDHLNVEQILRRYKPRIRRSAGSGFTRRLNPLSIDFQQSLCVLIQLVRGEQLRHAHGDSFHFVEKRDRVRDGSLADDGGENDLVFGIEGDPKPTVAQDPLQSLDRIEVLFFLMITHLPQPWLC